MQRDLEILEEVASAAAPPALRLSGRRLLSWVLQAAEVVDLGMRRLGLDMSGGMGGAPSCMTGSLPTAWSSLMTTAWSPRVWFRLIGSSASPSEAFAVWGLKRTQPGKCTGRRSCSGFDTFSLRTGGWEKSRSAQMRKGILLARRDPAKLQPEIYGRILHLQTRQRKLTWALGRDAAGLLDLGYRIDQSELAAAVAEGFAHLFKIEWIK